MLRRLRPHNALINVRRKFDLIGINAIRYNLKIDANNNIFQTKHSLGLHDELVLANAVWDTHSPCS